MSVSKDFAEIISSANKKGTQAYTSKADVVRIDGDTAFVHLDDGIPETPVALTINAKVGDTVLVRIANSGGYILGNSTSPPTDDTVAYKGVQKATDAGFAAAQAMNSALAARDSASRAQASADDAGRAADNAWGYAANANDAAVEAHNYADDAYQEAVAASQSAAAANTEAVNARNAAQNANVSANSALLNLSTVENVLDLLQWSYEHGYYRYCASETIVTPDKVYFTLTPTRVASPTGDPSKNSYYEITGYISGTNTPILIKSTDTTVDTQKEYYTVSGVTVTEPSGSPQDNGYYELIMDDTLSDYVTGHLAMDDRGLWLLPYGTPESMVYKVLISATQGYEGVTIFDNNGIAVARYGSDSVIGPEDGYHIAITSTGANARLSFMNHDSEIAYINGQELYITKTVVLDRMQLSDKWVWQYDNKDDSIYLKWIGQEV